MNFASLIMLLIASIANGDNLAVTISVSPSQVTVGDAVAVKVRVLVYDAISIDLDAMPENNGSLYFTDVITSETTNLLGMRIMDRTYTVIPFEVGVQQLPRLEIIAISPQGKETVTSVPVTTIDVRSVATSEDGPENTRGIKAPLEPEDTQGNPLPGRIIYVLILLLAAFIAWYELRHRAPASVRQLVKLTPARRALRDLSRLALSNLLKEGKQKDFYTRLSGITRRYLGLSYQILALEMTSQELVGALDKPWLEKGLVMFPLNELLERCDLVKFARFSPDQAAGDEGIVLAKNVVKSTSTSAASQQMTERVGN